ncbi:DUF417 family protein [Segniliparus rugosus]|uniref:DoxX family protein n=1 Tax=Segniliparus rugosus (strain ATCC BAA-974 / DSM 45345 / CCUG 50838 / CIP 108380 / JCM 13579 / CDC 945) TaxID=679197 RepID=E5XV11_SEGRC|nr:DUF417 family protein [Segniliparus rugosus]EFV11847.1 hypothetical protein HMPREF9336_03333 [Segniliparus rugosus ATCC BAA-974]
MDVWELDGARVRQAGLAVARLGLVVNLGWNGLAKFTAGEARSIAPLVGESPLFTWALGSLGLRGVSDIIGVVELAAVALLLLGVRLWWANAAATALCAGTFLITLSFFATSVDWSKAGWNAPDAFLLKDIVLLGASIALWRPKPSGAQPHARREPSSPPAPDILEDTSSAPDRSTPQSAAGHTMGSPSGN